MTATFASLCDIDARLQAAGHHPLTPWWRDELERFYAHPTARTLVSRVGRGGAKSHTAAKIALNETLFGDWEIPPGERHYWAFVSVTKDEAAQRLLLLESFLRALGIQFDTRGDEIPLRDAPRGFRVFAGQIGKVSGFRCYGYSNDELAKANDAGVNPSAEVCASLNAMCVTHRVSRRLLISSPLGLTDYHAQRYELGDRDDQVTAYAPSWVANPDGITEQATHEAEPDERVWRREYLAIPQAGLSSAFDPQAVARAIGRVITIAEHWQPIGVVDLSSGGGDAAAFGVCSWCTPMVDGICPWLERRVPRKNSIRIDGIAKIIDDPDGATTSEWVRDDYGNQVPNPEYERARRSVLVFHLVDAVEGRFAGSVSGSELVGGISREFKRYGVTDVVGDQREQFFAASEFQRHRLQFHPIPWTNANKIEAVTRLNRLFSEDAIALPNRPKLKRELLSYSERITSSGTIAYSARGSGHDDEASLLITAALAELERLMPGSTLYAPNRRHLASGR